jgi:predicted AlkP superfamily pyrophosphatase or phosphodiesterase
VRVALRSRAALGVLLAGVFAIGCAGLKPLADGGARPEPAELPILDGAPKTPARVVLVSVSGLVPADYLPAPGAAVPMPTLAALAQAGAAAERVVPVAPASSYPAHATLATGRLPSQHGIRSDRLLGDRGSVARRPTPRPPLRAPALWEAVGETGRRSVVLGWPGSSGGRIDLVFPESFTLEASEDWKTWISEHASPGLLDAARQLGADAPATAGPGPERDRLLLGLACEQLRSKSPPALLLLHLSQTEPILALAGPGSPEAQAAFAATDRELGRLVDCLRDAGFLESTAVLVAGDHGALSVHSSVSPNAALRDKGLIVPTVDGAGMQRWSAFVRSNGGSAFVYARTEDDARLVRLALAAAAARTKAFRIVPAHEMIEKGADPEAWFGLDAAEGYWIDEDLAGPIVKPSPMRGSWGNVAGGPALGPGFVAWGRGVRSGARIPTMQQTDVAPTAAALLGLAFGAPDGEPVAAALALPAVATAPEKEPVHAR